MTRFFRLIAWFCAYAALAACGGQAATADPIPPHESFVLKSKLLNEDRVINVFVPEQYADNDEKSYPVVYMPDGGIKEDFPHIANTLADLTASGRIDPVMLVGIENTDRRRDLTPASTTEYDRDYGPAGDGAKVFRAFIKDELIPEVESRYRTTSTRTIVGESAAGLFVVDTLFRMPSLFDNYIAMDPALWWNDHELVKQAKARLATIDLAGKSLWFAGSNAKDIQPYTRRLDKVIEAEARPGFRYYYADRPSEKHTTIFRASKEQAFAWALGNHANDIEGQEANKGSNDPALMAQ